MYRMLQVDLLPYSHALVVIANTNRDLYAYYSYYYIRDAYINVYHDSIHSVGNPTKWTMPEKSTKPNCVSS